MQHQKTWTITEIRDGERVVVATNASQTEALIAIRNAMYGPGAESLLAPSTQSVHELPLAA